jgi:hypothetical protein
MRTATTATTTALAVTAAPGSSTPSDVRQYARSAFGIRQTEAIGDHGTSCTIRPALWILQRKHQREKRSYGHVKADPPPAPSTAAPATIGQTEILATIVHNLLVLRTLRDMPTRLLSWPQHTVRFAAASPGRRLLVEELNTWRAERKPANIDEFVFATADHETRTASASASLRRSSTARMRSVPSAGSPRCRRSPHTRSAARTSA